MPFDRAPDPAADDRASAAAAAHAPAGRGGGPAPVEPTDQADPAPATINSLADPCFRIDAGWVIRAANPAAGALVPTAGGGGGDPLVGSSAHGVFPDAFGAVFNRECARAMRTGLPVRFEEQYLPRDTWLEVHVYPHADGATVLMHDAADRRRAAELLEDQTRVLERIARGRPLREVLDPITGLAERHVPGLTCAVFAADLPGRHLTVAAGPGFVPDYLQALDVLAVAPDGSPPGRAAFTLRPVVVADLAADPVEPRFRDAALKHGFRGCWAVPILSSDGALLGVLAGYRREPGRPADADARCLGAAANLAGIALERQLVEADLRQKEQQYRSIVETVQDGLIVADTQGYIVEANPAAGRIHGGTRESLVGRQAADLVRADYHGVLRRLLDEVRQGRGYHGDMVAVRKDGSSFPAEVTAAPFLFDGQRHALGVVRDVTARKKMEDSLRRTEERLRTVANGAPLVLFSLDRAGVFTLSEGQALASLGLRPGEVVGRSAFDVYAAYPAVVENLRMALGGEPRRFVAEIGELVFEAIVRPLRAPGGEIIGAVGVGIDVTEHTLTAEALRESEERFRASFHQAPLGVAHASPDGVVLRANDRLAAFLGTTTNEVVGRRVADWYAGDAASGWAAADAAGVAALVAGRADVVSAARSLAGPTTEPLSAVLSTSLVRGRQGEPRNLIITVTRLP